MNSLRTPFFHLASTVYLLFVEFLSSPLKAEFHGAKRQEFHDFNSAFMALSGIGLTIS